jgi:hypothetical protein
MNVAAAQLQRGSAVAIASTLSSAMPTPIPTVARPMSGILTSAIHASALSPSSSAPTAASSSATHPPFFAAAEHADLGFRGSAAAPLARPAPRPLSALGSAAGAKAVAAAAAAITSGGGAWRQHPLDRQHATNTILQLAVQPQTSQSTQQQYLHQQYHQHQHQQQHFSLPQNQHLNTPQQPALAQASPKLTARDGSSAAVPFAETCGGLVPFSLSSNATSSASNLTDSLDSSSSSASSVFGNCMDDFELDEELGCVRKTLICRSD